MWANLVSANFVTAVSLLTGSFVSFLSPVLDAESPVLSVLTLVWDHQSVPTSEAAAVDIAFR